MKKIITTVGTSLFTNFQLDEVRNKYGDDYPSISIDQHYKSIDDKKPRATAIYEDAYKHYLCDIKENVDDYWFADKYKDNKNASAEIASIIKIAEAEPREEFVVHLIATDTLLSVLAAEMIRDWFGNHKHLTPNVAEVIFQRVQPDFDTQKSSRYVVKDLRTDSQSDYEKGVLNLLELLNDVSESDSILNITGGYKGIVPIVTVWAQIKKVPIKYLFNESDIEDKTEVLTLDHLPLNFDWEFIETVAYALNEEVREGLSNDCKQDQLLLRLLKKSKLIDANKRLTALGELVQQYLTKDGQPTANNILGLFLEYKLYEFFDTKEYQNTSYKPLKVSIFKNPDGTLTNQQTIENRGSGYCEVDLYLKKPTGEYVLGEVKSYNQVKESIAGDLAEKASKIQEFRPGDSIPVYWLIVVSPSLKLSLGEWYTNPRDKKYRVLLRIKDLLGDKFRAYSYQFNLSSGKLASGTAAINTKAFLQVPIEPDELIEINLGHELNSRGPSNL